MTPLLSAMFLPNKQFIFTQKKNLISPEQRRPHQPRSRIGFSTSPRYNSRLKYPNKTSVIQFDTPELSFARSLASCRVPIRIEYETKWYCGGSPIFVLCQCICIFIVVGGAKKIDGALSGRADKTSSFFPPFSLKKLKYCRIWYEIPSFIGFKSLFSYINV